MAEPLKVDLNCDLGEGSGRNELDVTSAMMKLITSANIACGFHAGDPSIMAHTVALAKESGVTVGAHPGYPDLQGFGRRPFSMSAQEITEMTIYQLGALDAFARIAELQLSHVKPHGALYNLASEEILVAEAITRAVMEFAPHLILVGLAGSALVRAGEQAGLLVANEGFPDRSYLPDGSLMSRNQLGAVLVDPEAVASSALQLVREGVMMGGRKVCIDTLCLHGDNPQAVNNAKAVRRVLKENGIEICSLTEVLAV